MNPKGCHIVNNEVKNIETRVKGLVIPTEVQGRDSHDSPSGPG